MRHLGISVGMRACITISFCIYIFMSMQTQYIQHTYSLTTKATKAHKFYANKMNLYLLHWLTKHIYIYKTRGHTALHKAVQQKHRNICYMLVAAGASLTMRDANGLTPMMIAFQVEDNDLATYLESKLRNSFISIHFILYIRLNRTMSIRNIWLWKRVWACVCMCDEREILCISKF